MKPISTSRHGYSLLELQVYMACVVLLMGSATTAMVALIRKRPTDAESQRLDLACERLRQDLRFGAEKTVNGVRANGREWTVDAGELLRAQSPRVHVRDVRWDVGAGVCRVVITPLNGPPRSLLVYAETPLSAVEKP